MEVLTFRQAHKAFFEKSDLFFVCMLRPLSFDVQRDEVEIEAAQVINTVSLFLFTMTMYNMSQLEMSFLLPFPPTTVDAFRGICNPASSTGGWFVQVHH